MSPLPPGLEDFGERLERAAERDVAERRRAGRKRRRLRSLGLPVGAALVAAAVSAGAVRVADRGGEPIEPEPGSRGAALQAAKDPAVVMASATADPSGGPPWVVRAFTNPAGRACVQVGQLRDGVFGQLQGGEFRALPASAPGTCANEKARGPLVAVVRRPSVGVTLVFGIAIDRGPLAVRVGDRERRVRPVGLGVYLTVFEGHDPRVPVVVRSKVDGRAHVQRFP